MRRKLFTFLVAFLATLSGAVWAEENPSGTSESAPYDLATRGELTITDDGIYWVTSSSQTNNGIEISGNPTVHLKGINIGVAGTAIEVNWGGHPTFILDGNENIIESSQGPAISVPHDGFSNTTQATFQGNGLLEINMEESDKVAIGNAGDLMGLPHTCGNIIVKGGTIKTNGVLGDFITKSLTLEVNGVLICNKILGDRNLEGGILFENTTTGTMYGDVTLNSPLPEGYVVDLTKTLTIGEGNSIYTDQIKENGGVLNAYKVMYADNLDEAWGVKPTNELPVTKYWGANYPVATWDAGINPNITSEKANATYKQVPAKWWDGSAWIEAGATPNTADATGIKDVTYGAAWYLAEFNPTYLDTEGLTDPRTLWVPVDASFEWEDIKNPNSLAQAGLKIEENQIRKDLTQPLQEGDYKINLNYKKPANEPALTCIINATVKSDGYDINDTENVKVEQLITTGEYKGAALPKFGYSSQEIIRVSYKKEDGTWIQFPTGAYQVEYKKEGETSDWNVLNGNLQNVGRYSIRVAGKSPLLKGTKEDVGDFVITPKEVTIGVDKMMITAGKETEVNGSFHFVSGMIEEEGNVLYIEADPLDVSSYTEAGTFDVTYTGIKLTASDTYKYLTTNYSVSNTVEGQLIVNGPTEPEVKPDGENWIWSDQLNGFEKVYDGISYSLERLHVIFEDGSEKDMVLGSDYTINLENPIIKDAGKYEVEVDFRNSSYTDAKVLFVVTKCPMIVNFKKLNKSTIGQTLNAIEWVESYEDAVKGEIPSIKGTIKVAPRPINGVYFVAFEGLALDDNLQENFKAENYTATWKYNGTDITITDGDGDINIPIDTDDEGDGDGDGDIKLFRIYTDEVCAGVELEYSREVVKGGQSTIVTVNVEKGYDASALKLSYKEGMYGDWKPLTLNKDGQYQIKNIWNDIYVRAEGVVTGMEDIDGTARVYAKDGSLYIYTPQQDDIAVISMTGSVVKRTKQIGLQSYPLNQGIYVVRVGEQVFKVRVK